MEVASDLQPTARARGGERAVLALALAGFAALAWRLEFLCDDAYIAFRYARNLAEGIGLRYNPGPEAPVEGFTQVLWILWLAVLEWLGVGSELGSRLSSGLAGLALIWVLARHLVRRAPGHERASILALALPATFPPLAAWCTGGLETMAFALAVFALYDRLVPGDGRPRAVAAALCGGLALALRADGFVWVALVVAAALLAARLERRAEALRSVLRVAGFLALVLALLFLARWLRYQALVPNTARVKVAFGALTLERGALYLTSFLIVMPASLVALVLAATAIGRVPAARVLPAALVVLGNFGYVVLIGGDFMVFWRFLVPSVPFLTLLLAAGLERWGRGRALVPALLAVLVAALSLPEAFDRHVTPRALRANLDFRWSAGFYRSEYEKWRTSGEDAEVWAALGRSLARISQPGDSLVMGTIGAVGYHSRLVVHDRMGLVNRHPFEARDDAPRRSAGHERRVPWEILLELEPTYLEARFVPSEGSFERLPADLRPGGRLHERVAPEWLRPAPEDGVPPGTWLRVLRRVP